MHSSYAVLAMILLTVKLILLTYLYYGDVLKKNGIESGY